VTRIGFVRTAATVVAFTSLVTACSCRSKKDDTHAPPAGASGGVIVKPPNRAGLRPVSLPNVDAMEASVASQLRASYSSLVARIDGRTAAIELGTAYGELGKLLMAASYLDAAEACYLNAQTLAPDDSRWPYYLGHLYKGKGPLAQSLLSFKRALQLQPNDVATLVWLGDAYLAEGNADTAEPLFNQALNLEPNSASAHFGAGRVALARKNYARAAMHLERALALEPQATAIHYQLGMAYRGQGELSRADAQLAQKGDIEPRPIDPLMRQLDELLESAEAYNVRGGRELEAGNWRAAVDDFRKGLALRPSDSSLRHRLGTALYQMGDAAGAEEQFREVVRTSPEFAKAHFSLGLVLAAAGRQREAIESFSNALAHDGGYVQARLQLANALSHSGRAREALPEYQQVLERDPALNEAVFGYAMALMRLHRYRDAHDRLAKALEISPGNALFSYAEARLLAAAPDPLVRNGAQAKALVDELLKTEKSIDVGATEAMALAELGEYEQAAAVQRDVIAAAEKAGLREAVRHMMDNLRLYEHQKPCRTPFTDDELP
jgi:tetratricopeptide (TPR) repeat protein